MDVNLYFKKNGFVYGVAQNTADNEIEHTIIKFDNLNTAKQWIQHIEPQKFISK